MIRSLFTFFTSLALVSSAQVDADSATLLKFLPNGTSLTNVKIPSYDQAGDATTLFMADKVTVVDKDKGEIDVTNVEVELVRDGESTQLNLKNARYYHPKDLIATEEEVRLNRSNLQVVGQGAYFDLVTRELFLTGPSTTTYIPPDLAARVVRNLSLMMANPGAPSVNLSAEEEAALSQSQETAANTSEVIATTDQQQAEKTQETQAKSAQTDEQLAKFAAKTGSNLPEAQAETATPPAADAPVAEALVITNQGGTYLDTANNVLVYLGDVVVENAEMRLSCSKDLKVFMQPKGGESGEETKGGDQLASMGALEMKEIVATGDVKIVYKNTGKNPHLIATGATAFYKVGNEEVLLKGGYPKLQQGPNRSEALEEEMWVKLSRKGAVWSKGKQRQVFVPNK